jgi:hypothetical protein
MNAIQLLKAQHKDVRDLFERIESEENQERCYELFEELATNLVAHDAIEREIFYPESEKALGMTDELGEALVEHGLVEFALYNADRAEGDDFKYKLAVLKEVVEHHVREEEKEFLPKAEKAIGKERSEQLGQTMEQKFQQALEQDFREPLTKNLQQVLAGATKTKPAAKPRRSTVKARGETRHPH